MITSEPREHCSFVYNYLKFEYVLEVHDFNKVWCRTSYY